MSAAEQQQETLLVAQVATPPLVLIILGSVSYAALGWTILCSAWFATRDDIPEAPMLMGVEESVVQCLYTLSAEPKELRHVSKIGVVKNDGGLLIKAFSVDRI